MPLSSSCRSVTIHLNRRPKFSSARLALHDRSRDISSHCSPSRSMYITCFLQSLGSLFMETLGVLMWPLSSRMQATFTEETRPPSSDSGRHCCPPSDRYFAHIVQVGLLASRTDGT